MSKREKVCVVCGKKFTRNPKYSEKQWNKAKTCCRRCGATRRDINNDNEIITLFYGGYSSEYLANMFEMSPTHILRILRKSGVNTAKRQNKGGMRITEYGYLRFDNTKSNGSNAGRRLHHLIAEMNIGRRIRQHEVVHHIDGDKLNNHPNNLQVMSRGEHTTLHKKGTKNGK